MYLILCFKARDKEAFISLSWAQAFFEVISLTYYTSAMENTSLPAFHQKAAEKNLNSRILPLFSTDTVRLRWLLVSMEVSTQSSEQTPKTQSLAHADALSSTSFFVHHRPERAETAVAGAPCLLLRKGCLRARWQPHSQACNVIGSPFWTHGDHRTPEAHSSPQEEGTEAATAACVSPLSLVNKASDLSNARTWENWTENC